MASSALDVCGNINGFSMKRACFVAGTQVVVGEQITQSGELESENVEVADDRNGVYLVVAATAAAAVAFKVLEKKTSKKRVMIELNNIPENVEENAERESSRQNAAENKNLKRGRANSEPEKSRLASWFGGVSLFFLIVSLGTLLGSFVSNNADFKTSESVLASNFASDVSNAEQQTTKYVTKNIEEIQEGDEVLAYDVRSGEPVKSKVSATFHLKSDHLRYLTVLDANGSEQTFQTTDTHPFWVNSDRPDLFRKARDSVSEYDVSTNSDVVFEHDYLLVTESGCYIEAQDLNVGDRFIEPNGETSVLLKTWRETHPEGVDVYNFKVADNSNYFVIANYDDFQNGLEPVLVHNANYRLNSDNFPGAYLASKKTPYQVTPGIKYIDGVYVNKKGRTEPWRAFYDQYGRLCARTDYNAGNIKDGIPDVHYHLFEWGPGKNPLKKKEHFPGEFVP